MTSFLVQLDIYRGPLDLLLFLVRRHELDITDLPIARITEQFLEHLDLLEQIDVNAVGDFLEFASTLVEIKSRMVLPHGGEEEEPAADPRQALVRQLLEYKKFKDAASLLEERSRQWRQRFPRLSSDLPPRERNPAEESIHELEIWDLVSALGRILRSHEAQAGSTIVYDETPQHVFMQRVYDRLRRDGPLVLDQLFQPQMHKSTLVGMFLALLELIRHYGVRAEQERLFGEIKIFPPAGELGERSFAPAEPGS